MSEAERLRANRPGSRKRLNKNKNGICFKCRQPGHRMADCTKNIEKFEENDSTNPIYGSNKCYHCGSTEHTIYKCTKRDKSFRHAKCFVCNEDGHISRTCPKNPNGIFIHGGFCSICNKNDHLRKNCPRKLDKNSPNDQSLRLKEFKRYLDNPEEEDFSIPVQFAKKKPRNIKIT